MCNLYFLTRGQQAMIALARAMRDNSGNLPPLPGIFPDDAAPIVRTAVDGGARAGRVALGYAVTCLRARGQEDRFRRHQYPQYGKPPLATMVVAGEPMPGAVHLIQ